MAPVLFTVGHSTQEADEFVRLVADADIEVVADIRRHPGSRRFPQFNAGALEDSLSAAGVGYLPLGDELGGRRRPRPDSVNDGWRVRQFQGYADHMSSPEFAAGLAELERRARERPTAAMCAEADWRRCHRRLVADAALLDGFEVRHLMRDGSLEEHRLTEFAVVDGGSLAYPGQPRLA